jgi:hypothetical protein
MTAITVPEETVTLQDGFTVTLAAGVGSRGAWVPSGPRRRWRPSGRPAVSDHNLRRRGDPRTQAGVDRTRPVLRGGPVIPITSSVGDPIEMKRPPAEIAKVLVCINNRLQDQHKGIQDEFLGVGWQASRLWSETKTSEV